jgi:hypothetical protein
MIPIMYVAKAQWRITGISFGGKSPPFYSIRFVLFLPSPLPSFFISTHNPFNSVSSLPHLPYPMQSILCHLYSSSIPSAPNSSPFSHLNGGIGAQHTKVLNSRYFYLSFSTFWTQNSTLSGTGFHAQKFNKTRRRR